MDKDLASFAIKYLQKKKVDYAEARLITEEINSFMLKNSNPEMAYFDEIKGLGIRFIIKNNLNFVALNTLTKEKVKQAINKTIKMNKSKNSSKPEFSSSETNKKSYKVTQKVKLNSLDPKEKLKILTELDKTIKEAQSRYISLKDSYTEKYFINTEGSEIYSKIPKIKLFYFITLRNKSSIQRYEQFGSTSGYEVLKKWNLNQHAANEIKNLKLNLEKGVKSPTGKLDIVAGPEVSGIIAHEAGGHPYEADRIFGREAAQAGESFINPEMLQTRIGSDHISIIDDPTIENSYGFYLYDDEGVKAKKKVLVKNGIINEFLHDRSTSKQMNRLSNGSARASYFNVEPMVRMSNTYVKPGNFKEEELIEGVKDGIYLKSFMEWNIDDLRLNQKYVGCESYLIKNGKITQPVKSPILEITTPVLFSSVDAAANNLKFFVGNCGKGEPGQTMPVWLGGPSIRLRNIDIR